jgi:hypothetical protein
VEVKAGNIEKSAIGRNASAQAELPKPTNHCEEKRL